MANVDIDPKPNVCPGTVHRRREPGRGSSGPRDSGRFVARPPPAPPARLRQRQRHPRHRAGTAELVRVVPPVPGPGAHHGGRDRHLHVPGGGHEEEKDGGQHSKPRPGHCQPGRPETGPALEAGGQQRDAPEHPGVYQIAWITP